MGLLCSSQLRELRARQGRVLPRASSTVLSVYAVDTVVLMDLLYPWLHPPFLSSAQLLPPQWQSWKKGTPAVHTRPQVGLGNGQQYS